MKPKLLISTDGYIPRWDGITRFLLEVIPRLERSFEITVLAPDFKGEGSDIPGVKVVRLPLLPFHMGDIQFSRFRIKTVRELVLNNDVVFNQSIGSIGIMTIREAAKYGIPVASFTHSIDWELAAKSIKRWRKVATFLVKKLAKHLYNKCRLLMVPGPEILVMLQNIGVTTRMEKVSLGVDTQRFAPAPDKAAAKKAVGIDPHKNVVGFVGRIAREKNIPTLQQAFDMMRKDNPDTVLLIVGEGLRNEIKEGEGVIITGMTNDVIPYLQAMDVFVSPSLTETSSLATMEAMACGLPVIVTPVGNIPEYVMHEKNGLFFGRRDVEDLAKKIEFLLQHPDESAKLGAAARRTIEQNYQWDATAGRITELILELKRK